MKKLYIIVRNDLDPGLQAAQAVHAAMQFAYHCRDAFKKWFYGEDWFRPQEPHGPNNIVILQVPDEPALLALLKRAAAHAHAEAAFEVAEFREEDLDMSLTAIALGGEGARALVGSLPRALRQWRALEAAA